MKKKFVLLCVSILGLTLVFSGCGKKKRQQNQELNSSVTDNVVADSSSDSFDKSYEMKSTPSEALYSTAPESLGTDYSTPNHNQKATAGSANSNLKLNKKPQANNKKSNVARSGSSSAKTSTIDVGNSSKNTNPTTQKPSVKSSIQKQQPTSVTPSSANAQQHTNVTQSTANSDEIKRIVDEYITAKVKEKSSTPTQSEAPANVPSTTTAAAPTAAAQSQSQTVMVIEEGKNANPAPVAAR